MGKKLFYDKRLSIDSTVSCGSCHKQSKGFADNVSLTLGVFNRPGVTNAPTLANVAYYPYYTREGGIPTLEMQVLVPIAEHNEFGFNIVEIESRLKNDIVYQEMARKAYGRALDPFTITRSISTYERSIISGNSKYDDYVTGKSSLTGVEEKGRELFFSSRTNCSQCHSGFNFTNYEFKKTSPAGAKSVIYAMPMCLLRFWKVGQIMLQIHKVGPTLAVSLQSLYHCKKNSIIT